MAAGKTRAAGPKTEAGGPKTAPPAGGTVPRERIAERAHQIWREAGCPHGRDLDHWLQAEREFGPIRVYRRARPADAPRPLGDPEK